MVSQGATESQQHGRASLLLTPGPLTTSASVKAAMQVDIGSRDKAFIDVSRRVCDTLLNIVGGRATHVCVPLQGSGTFAVEAMLGNLVPRDGKVLILVNGAYGVRIARICKYYHRVMVIQETQEDQPADPKAIEQTLARDEAITHVAAVHCETTSGMINPLEEIADVVANQGRRLLIDSMSAFGALPLDCTKVPFDAVAASSNKCLQGVPGLGFCIVRRDALTASEGNAPSLSLDLHDQWRALERNGQWRFTAPTQVVLALDQALKELAAEGGREGREARYRNNQRILVEGMRALGFETLLPDALQAPIIVSFHMPADPRFVFDTFYKSLHARGYVIYPGKLTIAPSFRIGCIGDIGEKEIRGALAAVEATLKEMGVSDCAPKAASSALEAKES